MRYLSTLSLALIVHVLLSIGVLMALACTAEPATPAAAPTPSGPMYSEEEAIAILKENLQSKAAPRGPRGVTCLMLINSFVESWSATYDKEVHRWDVSAGFFSWSVYERTGSVVATGNDPVNQLC